MPQSSQPTENQAVTTIIEEVKRQQREIDHSQCLAEIERLRAALAVEHDIQRLMLERLGIEWTPGEPFYSLVEAEIERLAEGKISAAN